MGTAGSGFHDGELAVQQRAGVRARAARLEPMLAPPDLDGGLGRFLGLQRFAALTAVGAGGLLWTSPLVGPVGFLAGRGHELAVAALPRAGDPLADLPAGAEVGLVAIDLPARRRIRVNGTVGARDAAGFRIDVGQAYGNCPKYIHPHETAALGGGTSAHSDAAGLDDAQRRRLALADTAFLGTRHPTRGIDSSHRGGPPGFLTVEPDGSVSWPDYPGNDMFNSLGNLAVDPSASLLVPDFATGSALHVSGHAQVQWLDGQGVDGQGVDGQGVDGQGVDGHGAGERRVVLTPLRVIELS